MELEEKRGREKREGKEGQITERCVVWVDANLPLDEGHRLLPRKSHLKAFINKTLNLKRKRGQAKDWRGGRMQRERREVGEGFRQINRSIPREVVQKN